MAEFTHNTEFYAHGSQLGKRLLSSDVLFQSSSAIQSVAGAGPIAHCNFIYFCGLVQGLGLDFLPITWQPYVGLGGSGATSKIRQSLLGTDLSLAFKSISVSDTSRAYTPSEKQILFALFISEIKHMANRAVLMSPHIQHVDGICWSLSSNTGAVDPVLVYERASHGDLYHYMSSGEGEKAKNIYARIETCRDIAIGLHTLHSCDIVHGDVKPQNVLMLDIDHEFVAPKLCDFGYSTAYTDPNSTITVSRTIPWNAPEVGNNMGGYLPQEAVKTDVFSFGMLCLWTLFCKQFEGTLGIASDFTDISGSQGQSPTFKRITRLKLEDQLRPFCRDAIEFLALEPKQKESLNQLFDITLSPDPHRRASDVDQARVLLDQCLADPSGWPFGETPQGDAGIEQIDMEQHFDFQISASIVQLLRADFRIRQYITKSLIEEAKGSNCVSCKSNAAFQLSVCFSIGFGIPANYDSSRNWLHRSGKSEVDLTNQLELIKEFSWVEHPYTYHTHFLNNLHNEGFIRNIDYLDTYMSCLTLLEVKHEYERELEDLAVALGEAAVPYLTLHQVYAVILKAAGNYQDAIKIHRRDLEVLKGRDDFDEGRHDMPNIMSELADLYLLQGDFETSAHYCKSVKELRTSIFGPNHPLTLVSLHLEGKLLAETGNVEEAERTLKIVLEYRKATLGLNHQATLNVMCDLASVYSRQLRYEEAITIIEEEIHIRTSLLGPHHHSTLSTLCDLANVLIDTDKLNHAQKLLDQALFGLPKSLGEDHVATSAVLAGFGALYLKLQDYDKSLECYDTALLAIERTLGQNHPVAMNLIRSKAVLLAEMGSDIDEPKALFQQSLRYQETSLGEGHPETLVNLSEYCTFLLEHDCLEEAEKCYRILLQRQETHLGMRHIAVAATLCELGQTLERMENQEAETTMRHALDVATDFIEGKHVLGWKCMEQLAEYLHKKDINLEESKELYERSIAEKEADGDFEPMERYAPLHSLVDLCLDLQNLTRAIEAQRKIITIADTFEGEYADERMKTRAQLAQILDKAGELCEAEIAYRDALSHSPRSCNENVNDILECTAKLAWCLERQNKHDEARTLIDQAMEGSETLQVLEVPVRHTVLLGAAAVYSRQGDQPLAISLSQKVVEECSTLYGVESEETCAAVKTHARYSNQPQHS
ncbi:hypothetical protein IQ07DRAFT_563599 [Pyrenochaeta sp. DS3sAY3a]|nr:hypothetical protein IQ07DRAFT_563599 [Pyrenochaeta sp. DS3sAY3a]